MMSSRLDLRIWWPMSLIILLGTACLNRNVFSEAFSPRQLASITMVGRPHSRPPLRMSEYEDMESTGTSIELNAIDPTSVRFLGRGDDAIVRPGVVLVAPTHEYHHFYRKSAIFVHSIEEDENEGVFMVRGVIIDHPTPFTLAEMMEHQPAILNNPLGKNFLFRGGDKGGDGVILLHRRPDLAQSPIGSSGIYQGGWESSLAACAAGVANVDDFKAFFNFCQFTEAELENMFQKDKDGDAWMSLEIDTDIVLNQEWDRGDAWARLRNAVAQMH